MRRRRDLAARPAQAEHDVVGMQIAELVGISVAAANTIDRIGDRAIVEIAVGQIDLEILRHVERHAGIKRPGQTPVAGIAPVAAAGCAEASVDEIGERVVGAADARTDKGRESIPSAKIDIGVREENPGIDVALVGVADSELLVVDSQCRDARLGAIFSSRIEAQPVVEIVANAPADKDGVGDIIVLKREAVADVGGSGKVFYIGFRIQTDADLAAQIPAAEGWRRRLLDDGGRRRRIIGGLRSAGEQHRQRSQA